MNKRKVKTLIIDKNKVLEDFIDMMLEDDRVNSFTENPRELMFLVDDTFDVENFERHVLKVKSVI
jgi:hypothetical protein